MAGKKKRKIQDESGAEDILKDLDFKEMHEGYIPPTGLAPSAGDEIRDLEQRTRSNLQEKADRGELSDLKQKVAEMSGIIRDLENRVARLEKK